MLIEVSQSDIGLVLVQPISDSQNCVQMILDFDISRKWRLILGQYGNDITLQNDEDKFN